MVITCKRCGNFPDKSLGLEEKDFHEHHIIPKCVGGTDTDGRIMLCKRCHDIIHKLLFKVLWDSIFMEFHSEGECKKHIKNFTKKWISPTN